MGKRVESVNWEKPAEKHAQGPIPDFKRFCLKLHPLKDKGFSDVDVHNLSSATKTISDQFEKFFEKISNIPLLSAVLFWVENIVKDKFHAAHNTAMMQQLIMHGFIGLKDTHGHVWTLKHMIAKGHEPIIEAIRCSKIWDIEKREEYVHFYIDFANFLSEKTFGYVPHAIDPDLSKIKQRKLSHNDFIAIIKNLKERERIIAQLLYHGGFRNIEEILSLKIENIHASSNQVTLPDGTVVEYPKHILHELQTYIGERKKGYIFVGRKKERIDHTVPFRALKTVVSKLGLDPSFTFRDFVKDL